jgi:hypothetical protein
MQDKKSLLANKRLYVFLFIGIMVILFSLWLIGFTNDYKGEQANIFFQKTNNYMADFFNVAKYSADRNPYFSQPLDEKGYLPLSYMIMYGFSRMADYQHLGAFEAGLSKISLATSSFFVFFSGAIFFLLLYIQKSGTKIIKFCIAAMILLSAPFIRSFERGNLILLAVVLVMFFLMNYKSHNKIFRQLSFIALAIAIALKAYPALLGILLLYEKRWCDIAYLALYTLAFVFLPFLFIEGGFANIPQLFANIKLNSEHYSHLVESWRFGLRYIIVFFTPSDSYNGIYDGFKIMTYILAVISLVVAPFFKTKWKKYALLLTLIIMVPDNSGCYSILYMIPFFIMFLNERAHDKRDIIFLILFILIFNPFQIEFITGYLPNLCLSIIWIWLIVEGVISFVNKILERKELKTLPDTAL